MRRSIRRIALLLLVTLAFPAASRLECATKDRWLHVTVDGEETVRIHVPLATVAGVGSIPGVRIDADGGRFGNFDANRLRSIWLALKDHDGDLVNIDSKDEHVKITKNGSYLLVLVDDRSGDEKVEIRVPVKVLDALFPPDGTIDVAAALDALAAAGSREFVRIDGRNGRVRIWVDGSPESDD